MKRTAIGRSCRRIEAAGVVAVIRMKEPAKLRAVVDAIAEGGVRALEVTMTVPGAIELIRATGADAAGRDSCSAPGRCSTPRRPRASSTPARSSSSARSSAARSSTPATRATCRRCPGCFTPTEILDAWDAGADIVKVFPATALGPTFIKDVRAPLPQVKLMPTGGVTLDNAGDWIRAGAVAVGVGTALLDAKAIAAGDFDVLRANAERIVANVRAAREQA